VLFRYMWAGQGPDAFGSLESFITRLRRAGYEFLATHALYERLAAPGVSAGARQA